MRFVRTVMFVGLAVLWNFLSLLEGVLSHPICCPQCYQSQGPYFDNPFWNSPITYTYTIYPSNTIGPIVEQPVAVAETPIPEKTTQPETNNHANTFYTPICIEFPLDRPLQTVFNIKLYSDPPSNGDGSDKSTNDDGKKDDKENGSEKVDETKSESNSEASATTKDDGTKQTADAQSETDSEASVVTDDSDTQQTGTAKTDSKSDAKANATSDNSKPDTKQTAKSQSSSKSETITITKDKSGQTKVTDAKAESESKAEVSS